MRSILKTGGLFFSTILFLFTMSCGNNPMSPDHTTGTIKISIKGVTNGASNTLNKSSSLVTITSARVVIERIRFESIVNDTLDFRFREPFIQDLMLDTTLNVIETLEVPFGSYKETEVEIDDLDPEDGLVYTQNPELQDRSIVVKGYLNGNPAENFIYTSEFSEEQKREFVPPLILDENSPSTNVVLVLDMGMWFMDSSGNLLDPRSANNKNLIEDNIKDSIEIFEDKDDDGKKDD